MEVDVRESRTWDMEFVDLMMYGFWGEGHTSNLPNPFSDYVTASKTFVAMTQLQLDLWKSVPLAVNTQPDISSVGNTEVQDLCVRAGCWLRSDSIVIEEPIQIEELSNRPPCAKQTSFAGRLAFCTRTLI